MQDMDQDTVRYKDQDTYAVPEAARLLGITQDAVRKRIARNTIEHGKRQDGRVWVRLDTSETTRDIDRPDDRDKLLDALHDQIETLKEQLVGEREANRENRRIIAGLTQRIPELTSAPAPDSAPEPTGATETTITKPQEGSRNADPHAAPQTRQRRRTLWERIFG